MILNNTKGFFTYFYVMENKKYNLSDSSLMDSEVIVDNFFNQVVISNEGIHYDPPYDLYGMTFFIQLCYFNFEKGVFDTIIEHPDHSISLNKDNNSFIKISLDMSVEEKYTIEIKEENTDPYFVNIHKATNILLNQEGNF